MMGARDPTAGELGSNFATKVQGHADTEHVIKVPDVNDIVGLKKKKCIPCEGKNVKKNQNQTNSNTEGAIVRAPTPHV